MSDDIDDMLRRVGLGEPVTFAAASSKPARSQRRGVRRPAAPEASPAEHALVELLDAPPTSPPIALVDPSSLSVRFSRLKLFGKTAAHYFHACQEPDIDETLALRMGSGTHALLFDQPCVRFDGRRAGKTWTAFEQRHAGKVILNPREWDLASAVAGAVKRNRRASELLFDDTIIEQRIDWTSLGGRVCRSTPDARGRKRRHVVDLKSTRSADPKWFSRDAWKLYYYAQLAFYGDAIEHETTVRPDEYYLVAVESAPPHPVTVFVLDDEIIEHGHKMTRLWFEELLGCERSSCWPEYSSHVVPMGMPEFAREAESVELDIGGELVAIG